jgi:hypothetical protein
VTDNAGNTYQPIPAARSILGGRAIELWFAGNVPEGATLVTVDTTAVDAIVVWEVAGIDPNAPLDSGAKLDDQPSADLVTSPVLATTKANELVMSHISVNFDRTGFQQDMNVAFPIDRLRELVADGSVGSMAAVHYSFMGAFPPAAAEPHAQHLSGLLKADKVDAVLLVPV